MKADGPISSWLRARPTAVFADLREFLDALERRGAMQRVVAPVDRKLEFTELCRRSLCSGGPALLCENPLGTSIPMLGNLFGKADRIAMALGLASVDRFRELGELLAFMNSPDLPRGAASVLEHAGQFARLAHLQPRLLQTASCQTLHWVGKEVDLTRLPIQTCWPDDTGPLITWGLVVTRGVSNTRLNVGIYRQQLLARNKVIMRWLSHRGGAGDFREWQARHPGKPFPVAVAIGADPATILAAVAPIPNRLSEFQFAGLLRGARTQLVSCKSHDLQVPATAEIVLEGFIYPDETAAEGPFCDHTGYYNAVADFPVFTVERITTRENPVYMSTYLGHPPYDEPSVLAQAFNEMFIPLLQAQFPDIVDFFLVPAACSYRMAVVSIHKQFAGHARSIMMGVWSYLRQFTYTKFVVVVDADIDARDVNQVVWAISTRADPVRDTMLVENTPIDYLDFASPTPGLGGKMGIDATNKWPAESQRTWGRPAAMSDTVKQRVEKIWSELLEK